MIGHTFRGPSKPTSIPAQPRLYPGNIVPAAVAVCNSAATRPASAAGTVNSGSVALNLVGDQAMSREVATSDQPCESSNNSSIDLANHSSSYESLTAVDSGLTNQGASVEDKLSNLSLEDKAQRVRELEEEADRIHKKAQQLNKEGRFVEAREAYAAMHKLEDEATALAAEVGCVACVLGDPNCGVAADEDPQEAEAYFSLMPLPAWPSTASENNDTVQDSIPSLHQVQCEGGVRDRAAGSVIGSLVADAAAMGVHWVYDLKLMDQLALEREQQILGHEQQQSSTAGADQCSPSNAQARLQAAATAMDLQGPGLEFLNPPRSPFYAYPSGRNSPYGEQTFVLLQSISENAGLDCVSYAHAFGKYFGQGFDGYRDVSTKGFLRNYARGSVPPLTGAPDAQANCIARAAPFVAGWAGSPDLWAVVRRATKVTQNSDIAVAWASAGAAILEAVVLGSSPSAAVAQTAKDLRHMSTQEPGYNRLQVGPVGKEISDQLTKVLQLAHLSVPQAVAELGRNCHMPNALTTPLHVVLHLEYLCREFHCNPQADIVTPNGSRSAEGAEHSLQANPGLGFEHDEWNREISEAIGKQYVRGIRLAIREGGCCASRASYTGALLGALAGSRGIPDKWKQLYTRKDDVQTAVDAICSARDHGVGIPDV